MKLGLNPTTGSKSIHSVGDLRAIFTKKMSTAQLLQNPKNDISTESLSLGSFHATNSIRSPKTVQLESVVNFVAQMPEYGHPQFEDSLQQLSDLTQETLLICKDSSFKRTIRAFGWTGKRFSAENRTFDRVKILQAISNLYLKYQYQSQSSMENIVGADSINNVEKIAAFCPDTVVEILRTQPNILIESENGPTSQTIYGTALLIDISGFSKYSAAMCSKGAEGLDELRKTTSGLLGRLVKAVYEHEGDVIAFAGDALICIFQDLDEADTMEEAAFPAQDDLKSVNSSFRALHCASVLRDVDLFGLSTHIGISCGEMKVVFLGGLNGMWTYVFNGSCISQLSSCIDDAAPHHVVVTKECFLHLKMLEALEKTLPRRYPEIFLKSIGDHGNYHFENFGESWNMTSYLNTAGRYNYINKLVHEGSGNTTPKSGTSEKSDSSSSHVSHGSPRPGKKQQNAGGGLLQAALLRKEEGTTLPPLPPSLPPIKEPVRATNRKLSVRNFSIKNISMEDLYAKQASPETENVEGESDLQLVESLTVFVPLPVMTALHTESNHQIGELRTVTTIFLSLDSYDPVLHADPSTLQGFFLIAQQVLAMTGGYLRQFLIDDKGCVLIVMWGIPMYTYANNCSRALYFAYHISQRAKLEVGHDCSIGITTGSVFCGTIGAAERCDYVGIGNEVNLAARFMSKAHGRILIDHPTYENLNEDNRLLLDRGEALMLKGMPHLIQPYVYLSDQSPVLTSVDSKHNFQNKLLKKRVMHVLESQLDKIANSFPSNISPKDYRQRLVRAPKQRAINKDKISDVHVTILCGPAGSGKGTAANYFRLSARARGIPTIHLTLQSSHRNHPFGMVRDLLFELIGEEALRDEEHGRSFLENLLNDTFGDESEDKALARITLNAVLGNSSSGKHTRSDNTEIAGANNGDFSGKSVSSSRSKSEVSLSLSIYEDFMATGGGGGGGINADEERFSPLKRQTHSSREQGDLSIYRILATLLKGTPTALIIEDAHYCDELSWNELYLMLIGPDLELCVLLTMKSNQSTRKRGLSPGSSSEFRSLGSPRFSGASGHHNASMVMTSSASSPAITPTLSPDKNMNMSLHHMRGEDSSFRMLEKIGLESYSTGMFPMIVSHGNTTMIELKSLTEEEVKTLLTMTLKVDTISNDLIRLVMDVSSGNTYWVKNIAQFIREQGIQHLETAILGQQSAGQSALKALIVCRVDLLDAEAKIVVKQASIVGFEFTAKMLEQIGRTPLRRPLNEILAQLEKHGFIECIEEAPEVMIYAFQNEMLQKTLYEMILPSDAAGMHLDLAVFMEGEYHENLRLYYPSLAYHYRHGGNLVKAFKYEIKVAALAVSSGAFNDGFAFAETALDIASCGQQIDALLLVVERAIEELETLENPVFIRKLSSQFKSFMFQRQSSLGTGIIKVHDNDKDLDEDDDDDDDEAQPYQENKLAAEKAALNNFRKLKIKAEILQRQFRGEMDAMRSSTYSQHPELVSGQDALIRSMTHKQLSWQPSFNLNGLRYVTNEETELSSKNLVATTTLSESSRKKGGYHNNNDSSVSSSARKIEEEKDHSHNRSSQSSAGARSKAGSRQSTGSKTVDKMDDVRDRSRGIAASTGCHCVIQ